MKPLKMPRKKRKELTAADHGYITRVDVNIAILREIERIHFREKMRRLMPLVAQQLRAAGVDFSKVDFSKVADATDAEIDQVFDFVSS